MNTIKMKMKKIVKNINDSLINLRSSINRKKFLKMKVLKT